MSLCGHAVLAMDNQLACRYGGTLSGEPQVQRSHATASFLADNLVIFNVKGNHYRLRSGWPTRRIVVIRWVGTHAEYTKRIGQKS
jgi:mRNA interferase HigB